VAGHPNPDSDSVTLAMLTAKHLALVLLFAAPLAAQVDYVSSGVRYVSGADLVRVRDYVTLPAACTPFTLLVDSDADTTGSLYLCGSNGQTKAVGSAATGDIEGVGVTAPITGGGTSGSVTIACATCATAAAGGSLTTSGAHAVTLTATGTTDVTLPTTGTLATTAGLAAYLPLAGGTLTGHLLFTDNTYDLGASGATRPRTGYFGTSVITPLVLVGNGLVGAPSIAFSGDTDTGFYSVSGNQICASTGAACRFVIAGGTQRTQLEGNYSWSNTSGNANATSDTSLVREAAGVVGASNGSTGNGAFRVGRTNGATDTWAGSVGENLTLSTGGTTTNTSASLAPANSIIRAITARVTTEVTTATDWSVAVTSGIASCTTAWVAIGTATAAQTTLTAGTTVIFQPASGLSCHVGTASTLTVTTTGTPGAGAIRLVPFYEQFVPPTS